MRICADSILAVALRYVWGTGREREWRAANDALLQWRKTRGALLELTYEQKKRARCTTMALCSIGSDGNSDGLPVQKWPVNVSPLPGQGGPPDARGVLLRSTCSCVLVPETCAKLWSTCRPKDSECVPFLVRAPRGILQEGVRSHEKTHSSKQVKTTSLNKNEVGIADSGASDVAIAIA